MSAMSLADMSVMSLSELCTCHSARDIADMCTIPVCLLQNVCDVSCRIEGIVHMSAMSLAKFQSKMYSALLFLVCKRHVHNTHVHNSKQNVFCVDACTHTDVCTALCEQYTSPPLFTLVYI